MYTYICICICIYTYTYVYIYIYIYTHVHMHIYIYIYMYIITYNHIMSPSPSLSFSLSLSIYIYIYTNRICSHGEFSRVQSATLQSEGFKLSAAQIADRQRRARPIHKTAACMRAFLHMHSYIQALLHSYTHAFKCSNFISKVLYSIWIRIFIVCQSITHISCYFPPSLPHICT